MSPMFDIMFMYTWSLQHEPDVWYYVYVYLESTTWAQCLILCLCIPGVYNMSPMFDILFMYTWSLQHEPNVWYYVYVYLESTTWAQCLILCLGSFLHLFTSRTQALHMSPDLNNRGIYYIKKKFQPFFWKLGEINEVLGNKE